MHSIALPWKHLCMKKYFGKKINMEKKINHKYRLISRRDNSFKLNLNYSNQEPSARRTCE